MELNLDDQHEAEQLINPTDTSQNVVEDHTSAAEDTKRELSLPRADPQQIHALISTDTDHYLPLSVIRLDGGTQMRTCLDNSAVVDYAREMRQGARFPPVEVVYDGDSVWLAHGFHRLQAARQAGLESIQVIVWSGTLTDARLIAARANRRNGVRRDRAALCRAIETVLTERFVWSDYAIADFCGTTNRALIRNIRQQLVDAGTISKTTMRQSRNGRQLQTTNIGTQSRTDLGDNAADATDLSSDVTVAHGGPDLEKAFQPSTANVQVDVQSMTAAEWEALSRLAPNTADDESVDPISAVHVANDLSSEDYIRATTHAMLMLIERECTAGLYVIAALMVDHAEYDSAIRAPATGEAPTTWSEEIPNLLKHLGYSLDTVAAAMRHASQVSKTNNEHSSS